MMSRTVLFPAAIPPPSSSSTGCRRGPPAPAPGAEKGLASAAVGLEAGFELSPLSWNISNSVGNLYRSPHPDQMQKIEKLEKFEKF